MEVMHGVDSAGEPLTVSEGKLVFQVRYDTLDKLNQDRPTGRETELSVKSYRDDTAEGEWEYTVDVMNKVTDAISGCGHQLIRYAPDC